MFLLKTPPAITLTYHPEGDLYFGEMETKGEYFSLEEAIEAAIQADLDLESAVIEKNGGRHSVNDWIACPIAGGHCAAG
jgi:hypothetical protein